MNWISTFTPLAALALIGLMIGALKTWQEMQRLRSSATDPSVLLSWQDDVGLDLHKESALTAAMLTNDILRLLIAGLCFAVAVRSWGAPPAWVGWYNQPVYLGSIGLALLISCFIASAALTFWFASYRIRPVTIRLTDEGLYRGQLLVRWQQVSHYQFDSPGKNISLYSRKCPSLVLMTCRFPTLELFEAGRAFVAARLPAVPPRGPALWYRSKAVFFILLLLTTAPFFLIGVVIYPINALGVWGYYPAALFVANYLSVVVIRAYN
jgi:hypothetical protein